MLRRVLTPILTLGLYAGEDAQFFALCGLFV
jgi:hypothetical protein